VTFVTARALYPVLAVARVPAMRLPWSPFALAFVAACGSSSPSAALHPGAADGGETPITIVPPPDGSSNPVARGGSPDSGEPIEASPGVRAADAAESALAAVIPAPTGVCPSFANGSVTFSPAGIPARTAQVYMSAAAQTLHGPLIFYWYATGSGTAEAEYSLGATLQSIEAAGGIVVAPTADPGAGEFEWFIVNGSPKMDDFLVADEIVACAAKNTQIDTSHVHSMGMSAGALQTTAFSFTRSAYLASVATYSGGMPSGYSPMIENPANKFAALIFDGGSTDDVYGVDFQAASQTYFTTLTGSGHFAAICDHGMGHSIPLDAAPSVAQFFHDNAFGVSPSPYANGLPASFPSYCTL